MRHHGACALAYPPPWTKKRSMKGRSSGSQAGPKSAVCVFRSIVTDRFGIVTGEFGNVTDRFGDVTDRVLKAA